MQNITKEELFTLIKSAVKSEIDPVAKDVASLKQDVSELKSDVSELKSDMIIVKSDIAELKSDVSELKSDMIIVKSDIAGLKVEVTNINIKIDTQTETILSSVQEMLEENRLESSDRVEAAMEQSEDRMSVYGNMYSENRADIKNSISNYGNLDKRVSKLEDLVLIN